MRSRIIVGIIVGVGLLEWLVLLSVVAYFAYAIHECRDPRGGSYVQEYNQRLMDLAEASSLVGKPEEEIEKALGKPTSIWRNWNPHDMETGEPEPGAKLTLTYNYFPFRFFPSKIFQVHLSGGDVVTSLEMYDD